jgi:hypothetical protein
MPTRSYNFLINVEPEHIQNGNRASTTSCPIALALNNAPMSSGSSTSISLLGEWFVDSNEAQLSSWKGFLPEDACDFIRAFDDGEDVEPFTFNLTVHDWAAEENTRTYNEFGRLEA